LTKLDKILYAKTCIANDWDCLVDYFSSDENVILETDKSFFEIVSFGSNAVIRADKCIIDWCNINLSGKYDGEILDGDSLYLIETKMREYGKKLGGEHTRLLHLNPENTVIKPDGFVYDWYEADKMESLYLHKYFENALNYDVKGEILALTASKDDVIASIVAVDDINYKGLWQIGVDTIDKYKGKGLASYLIKEIAKESELRNKLTVYTTWIANIASMRSANKAGFLPVWTGYYAVDMEK
jgi:RimJ/RimL family protein N-acetyltransferase